MKERLGWSSQITDSTEESGENGNTDDHPVYVLVCQQIGFEPLLAAGKPNPHAKQQKHVKHEYDDVDSRKLGQTRALLSVQITGEGRNAVSLPSRISDAGLFQRYAKQAGRCLLRLMDSAVVIQLGHQSFKFFPRIEKMQTHPQISGIFQGRNENAIFFD
jgi:hypothetical protein